MAKRIRWLRPEAAYCEVQRTVDRQFFFVPNETIRNIIGASVGRAQRKYPVKLYWIDFNINHKQSGRAALSDSPEHIENLVNFDKLCNSLIARGINQYLGREGAMFSSRNRSEEAIDDWSLEQHPCQVVAELSEVPALAALGRDDGESHVGAMRGAWLWENQRAALS